jgi:tetratricopeptide (TPR) repeat protein
MASRFRRHSRIPAALTLVLFVGLGAAYLKVWGTARSASSIDEMEKRIAGAGENVDAATLREYGELLLEAGRYAEAVPVYHRALDQDRSDARLQVGYVRALALAGSPGKNDEKLYEYLRELMDNLQFKRVVDLLESNDLKPYMDEDRFERLHTDAKNQLID